MKIHNSYLKYAFNDKTILINWGNYSCIYDLVVFLYAMKK